MFLNFYRLREQPFGVTPDPRFLYFSPAHREALASLFYGIETGRGFLSLVAQPGMGKTTLLFQLLKRWKGYVHSAFLFQTQCDSRELLRYLMEDLGLDSQDRDIVRMHTDLNDFLFRETKAGKRVVLFIDEAQNLSDSVLETVRLLSDFEDRKSTRLNSSHGYISYAVFCLKKKKNQSQTTTLVGTLCKTMRSFVRLSPSDRASCRSESASHGCARDNSSNDYVQRTTMHTVS